MLCNVAICGGIAVGKTTLGRSLSNLRQEWTFIEESPSDVPFIFEFYEDKARWAFHSRIGMLTYFFRRSNILNTIDGVVLQDRMLHELIVFAEVQRKLGTMRTDEFDLYSEIFQQLSAHQPRADLVIRCQCDRQTAMQRIVERGRTFEAAIAIDYLDEVEAAYDRWQERNSATMNFIIVDTGADLEVENVVRQIEEAAGTDIA